LILSSMNILVVDCGSSKVPQLAQVLNELGHTVHTTPLLAVHTVDLSLFEAIVSSGAPVLVTERAVPMELTAMDLLLDTQLPLLGICFSHQLIGMAFGAEPYRCPEDRADQAISFDAGAALFEGLSNPVEMNEDHCEAIHLPEAFQRLASSPVCRVEAMVHQHRCLYGVQFHPETSGINGKTLLKNFCDLAQKARA